MSLSRPRNNTASKLILPISSGQPELFTLPIFGFRIYVLNSRHLFSVIQRNARTLSFRPFSRLAAKVWCDVSQEFLDIHDEGHRWVEDLYRDTRTALAPSKGLDYQNLMTGESLQRFIDDLDYGLESGSRHDFKLYDWIHHLISVAAADGVYGKNSPFRDPEVEKNYWYFDLATTIPYLANTIAIGYGLKASRR
jgi:hypothetical protein